MKCEVVSIAVQTAGERAACSGKSRSGTQCDWALIFLTTNGGNARTEQGRADNCEVVNSVAVTSDRCLSCKVQGQVIVVTNK